MSDLMEDKLIKPEKWGFLEQEGMDLCIIRTWILARCKKTLYRREGG